MCQLTVVNTKNKELNAVLGTFLANINSLQNRDGFGAIVDGVVYKSEAPGFHLTNLLETFRTDTKILIHVRRASSNNANREKKQHPFKAGRYLLMHNGSLTPLGKSVPSTMIDSEFFASELGKAEGKNIVEKLEKTLKDFVGKFAFLIYDTKTGESYAVRGRTADLHIVSVNGGYIVNTEEDTLAAALVLAKNFYPDLVYGEIKALDTESVYFLGDSEVKKIGAVKEAFPQNVPITQYPTAPWYRQNQRMNKAFDVDTVYELELLLESYYTRFNKSPFEASLNELKSYIAGGK